jgi:RNA polymerase sigma-70 factor, ECF subfamily
VVLSDLDRNLLERCLAGADGAWEQFVDRYLALLTHVVTSAGRTRMGTIPSQWRDDLVAEVLLYLIEDDFAVLRQFRGQSSLGTYLVVIARRVAVRKLIKMRKSAAKRLVADIVADNHESLAIEDIEQVKQMLSQMPEQEATAIRMFHLEHKSYSDIGNVIGVPENSVGPILSRARKRMKQFEA